jgi:hypothetical protein
MRPDEPAFFAQTRHEQRFAAWPTNGEPLPRRAHAKPWGSLKDHESTVTPISIIRKKNPREGVQRSSRPGRRVLRPSAGKPSELGGEETVAASFPGDSVLPSASHAAIPGDRNVSVQISVRRSPPGRRRTNKHRTTMQFGQEICRAELRDLSRQKMVARIVFLGRKTIEK